MTSSLRSNNNEVKKKFTTVTEGALSLSLEVERCELQPWIQNTVFFTNSHVDGLWLKQCLFFIWQSHHSAKPSSLLCSLLSLIIIRLFKWRHNNKHQHSCSGQILGSDQIRNREGLWNLLPSSLPTCPAAHDILVCTVWLTAVWWVIQGSWWRAVKSSSCSRGIYQEPVRCFPSLPTYLSC